MNVKEKMFQLEQQMGELQEQDEHVQLLEEELTKMKRVSSLFSCF